MVETRLTGWLLGCTITVPVSRLTRPYGSTPSSRRSTRFGVRELQADNEPVLESCSPGMDPRLACALLVAPLHLHHPAALFHQSSLPSNRGVYATPLPFSTLLLSQSAQTTKTTLFLDWCVATPKLEHFILESEQR